MKKSISEHIKPKAWLLISCGDDRQHGGNDGYDDEISTVYKYDNDVQNFREISEGDLVLLSDKKQLIGVAKIELIRSYQGIKIYKRCPSCLKTHFNPREIKKPKFHCYNCGYDFDTPQEDAINCTKFDAYFGNTFVETKGAVSMKILREACQQKGQMSIKSIELEKIKATLLKNAPAVAELFNEKNHFEYFPADEASEYFPKSEDRREIVFQQIKQRRGQRGFRDSLRKRYGEQCMITGLNLLDVLEAAHISPYRGVDDNHPDNGLLLRADLHTLFDLNLLGINPESLEVKFHPKAMETIYQKLDGRKLRCSKYKPSKSALESRWQQFLNRLNEDY